MSPGSLRGSLLRRLLPAMLALLAAGAGTAYWVALRSATLAYDRALLDIALAISEQVKANGGTLLLNLSPQAQAVLLTDKYDRIYFAVRGPQATLLAGEPDLPAPPRGLADTLRRESRVYYDTFAAGRPIRVAALATEKDGIAYTVLAGETQVKRNALVREILIGMFLPEILLVAATLILVGLGVRTGLAPLTGLRQQLAGRSDADLSPIVAAVPEEIQPVVGEINDLLTRLDRSLTAQKHFISDAAHQLRTPIAVLVTQFEVALRDTKEAPHDDLQRLLATTRRLSHLADQLLTLARAEFADGQPIHEVELATIIRQGAEQWLPLAIAKNIDLGFDLDGAQLRGSPLLLTELLTNLVENAIRHTPQGGTITVSCGTDQGQAWLSVEDSGPGVVENERSKIFQRFYQPATSTSQGCGLGLAIVDEIARRHGGRVAVDQAPALGGARFRVTFLGGK